MVVQNSNNQKKDKKIKDEEKKFSTEKNLSWRSYLVEHNAIKEGTELLFPSCSLYSTQLWVIICVC
jgi:hypothetical protein